MKKYLISFLACSICILLSSWGPEGHSTIASVAEKHLTPNAATAIRRILGGQRMSEVSSWADQYRLSHPETEDWHFLNVDDNLNFHQFVNEATTQAGINIYKSLQKAISDLKDKNVTGINRQMGLNFLIHFVGDAHQPMHVSRAIDRGGNNIPVTFLGQKTNLHSLWDGALIQHDLTNYDQMAAKIDQNVSNDQIQQWQSDGILQWLWESYQISAQLYKEAAENTDFEQQYYETHIPVAEKRLEMGGIRLAGVLNRLFEHTQTVSTSTPRVHH